jgi:transmembrane sensor
MERECLAWQAQSAAHRLAFERCTDTWQYAAGVQRAHMPAPAPNGAVRSEASPSRGRRWALALATLGAAAFVAVALWPNETYGTGVGEQRLIVLADGSRMTLNTSTDVRVKQTDALRAVTVNRGEALFEVTKDASRPFVVSVSDAVNGDQNPRLFGGEVAVPLQAL